MIYLSACANPINDITAQRYYGDGAYYAEKNEWFTARMAYGRAWTNAKIGNLSDDQAAQYAFHYGIASGVICDWKEAERGLNEALQIDIELGKPTYYEHNELAHMYEARSIYEEAAYHFNESIENAKKHNALERHPAGLADSLARYSRALEKLGKHDEALIASQQANDILSRNPDMKFPPGLPYGKYCHQNVRAAE